MKLPDALHSKLFLRNMPPKKKLRLPEDQPTLKSMGFGKSRPPSPGQTDSEADTSNVSNDANQAKSPPVPAPPVPNRKFQEKWISLYPWLVHRALSLST